MRILLALIHNNNLSRLETARQTIQFVERELSKLNPSSIDKREYHKQDPLAEISVGFWRRVQRFSNESQYLYLRSYLEMPIVKWLPSLLLILVSQFIFFPNSKARIKIAVEQIVSNKHLQALSDGVDYDFVLVFEDDAVLLEGGDPETGSTLRYLLREAYDTPGIHTHIDFAGGFKLEDVAPAGSRLDELGKCLSSSKLFTNTACGYVLSRSLNRNLLERVESDTRLKWLGIDFLLNRVFLESGSNFPSRSIHLINSRVGHGSMTGEYSSWEEQLRDIS